MSSVSRAGTPAVGTPGTEDSAPDDPLGLRVYPGAPVLDAELPRCAIVILNLNGRQHLKPCFETLRGLDYPEDRFSVILIDNASTDGSVPVVKAEHSWVQLIENPKNVGFSVGCNQGAKAARDAEVVVFLNNDMRVEPGWLRALVNPLVRGECQATTARMYSWDGKQMNSAGGGMNFHGIGIQRGYLREPGPEFEWARKSLFACGGAMAMKSELFEELGGFDEEFFAYYEDVDLGWRTWVQGFEVWYVPDAICYHHHSSTSRRLPIETIRLLQVRNPLLACFKNYDEENLSRILPAMLALAVRRMCLVSGLEDDTPFRIERLDRPDRRPSGPWRRFLDRFSGKSSDTIDVKRICAADLVGINDLLGNWDHWRAKRARVQEARCRPDSDILRLFLRPEWCIEGERGYRELHRGLSSFFGLDQLFHGLSEPGPDPDK